MPSSATAGGFLLVLAIVLPVVGVLLSLVLGGRHAERIVFILMPAGLAVAVAIAAGVWRTHHVLQYVVGSWEPPLGVAFRADGLSAAMIVTAALLICGIGLFARAQFSNPREAETRAPLVFWTLLPAVWGALNAVFISNDLFNLYVALELLTFAAVPLVCLDGRAETLAAALRYLLFALLGSILYLLGAVLLYGSYGTLDIVLLSGRIHAGPIAWAAISLMTAGLLAKAALYPFHLWLPPAHAGAPAPASAILSGLVVKAPFFLVVRLWFDVMPGLPEQAAAQVLGMLGAAAICLWQRRGTPPGAAETADRLFDGGADRLPVPDVPARRQARNGPSVEHGCLDWRCSSGHLARLRQGRHVHGGGANRRGTRARPDFGARWHRPGPADNRLCLRGRRPVADGSAAQRRLCGESDVADGSGRSWPMVVGAGRLGGRVTRGWLHIPRARPSFDRCE